MTETPTSTPEHEPRAANDVPCGNVVSWPDGDGVIFVKAERQGTDYVHHYLIQLDPMPSEDMALIYVDPDDLLIDHDVRPVFDLGEGINADAPGIGHVFENKKGTYLKVIEDPKSQKMFAFIDISTGDICRRQDRAVTRVHMQWRIKTI